MANGRKRGWLSRVLDRSAPTDDADLSFELVVIEGADEGARFTIDRSQIQIGRAAPGTPADGSILLSDRSVSAKQAIIGSEGGKLTLQHLPSATNPTRVNGRKIKQRRLRDGDRVALGLVVLEVRSIHRSLVARAPAATSITTEPIHMAGEIVVTEGPESLVGRSFPLDRARTSIGRDLSCDVVLDIAAISRTHASLVWEDDQLIVVHESQVNPTDVNGRRIRDRRRLFDRDEIRLSERVTLGVVLSAQAAATPAPSLAYAAAATDDATRLTRPDAPNEPRTARDAPDAPTMLDAAATEPVAEEVGEEEATAITAPDYSDGDRTTAAEPPIVRDFDEGDATRVAGPPPAADSEQTMLRPSPFASPSTSPPDEPESEAPRTEVVDLDAELASLGAASDAPDAPTMLDASAAEGARDERATAIETPDYSEGDKTTAAEAPIVRDFGEGDVTRIAGPPAAADSEKTMLRPSPFASPSTSASNSPPDEPEPGVEPPRTEVRDLDAELGNPGSTQPMPAVPDDGEKTMAHPVPPSDGERTLVRPLPDAPAAGEKTEISGDRYGDGDKTVFRPVPNFEEAATTRIIEPNDGEEEEDEEEPS